MSGFGCLVGATGFHEKVTENSLVMLCNIGYKMHLRSIDLACILAFKLPKLLEKKKENKIAKLGLRNICANHENFRRNDANLELPNICAEPKIVYFCTVKPLHHQLLTVH